MPSRTPYQSIENCSPRPPLPLEHLNPYIRSLNPLNVPSVKFQEIVRDDQRTIVARMKVQTPQGHAFILRRLDTGAVSLTTMFRAAFPTASDEAEKAEAAWAKANFETAGTNRSGKARFAGTWVSPVVSLTIGEAYGLTPILEPLTDAMPDPAVEYRKSSRAQGNISMTNPEGTPKGVKQQLPTPAPSFGPGPTPAKRVRREASPAATPAQRNTTASSVASPRRSGRTASPAQPPLPKTLVAKPAKSPLKASRSTAIDPTTPGGSDETAVDEDVPDVPGPDPEQDIAEQRELIANLKKQRDEQQRLQVKENQDEAQSAEASGATKRGRDEVEAPLKFDFKEPETEERAIASNRRVSRFIEMTPERRSAAWGTAAFATVFGLLAFVPNPWF